MFFLGAVSDSVWVFVRNRDGERGRGILWLRFCPNNYLVMVELGITLMDFVFMDLSVWAVRLLGLVLRESTAKHSRET